MVVTRTVAANGFIATVVGDTMAEVRVELDAQQTPCHKIITIYYDAGQTKTVAWVALKE